MTDPEFIDAFTDGQLAPPLSTTARITFALPDRIGAHHG
jgi:hypothetical protein